MKIGILTFHYSVNVGSVLQAYCVYKIIEKYFPGHTVQIINLIPYNREIKEWNFISKNYPFLKIDAMLRYISLRKFLYQNLKFSNINFSRDIKSQIDFINRQKYDLIVTGSDTVWMNSPKLDNILPSIYYIPQAIISKKISIAASVDPLINMNPYLLSRHELKDLFEDYNIITVRDSITRELLENIGIRNVFKISDPTLLYEFENDLHIAKNKSKKIRKKNALIWIDNIALTNRIKRVLSEVFELDFIDKQIRKNRFSFNYIHEDLNVYKDLDILITDRFHRSIFGLKLSNAVVINIERFDKNPFPNSKGRDLFDTIGISEYSLRFDSNDDTQFDAKLVDLILRYGPNCFIEREYKLNHYIRKNKDKWNDLILNFLDDRTGDI